MMRWLILVSLVTLERGPRPLWRATGTSISPSAPSPSFGFEGWRRMGYAHFAGSDSGFVGFLRRRTGDPMLTVTQVTATGDSVLLTQDARVMMRAAWHGDTLTGVSGTASGCSIVGSARAPRDAVRRRARLRVWTMPPPIRSTRSPKTRWCSCHARRRASGDVYRAAGGQRPFGVVMQRTPYRRSCTGRGAGGLARLHLHGSSARARRVERRCERLR